MATIPRVLEVKPLPPYCLWLRFHDGLEGSVDLRGELWGPMFEPLKYPEVLDQVKVDPDLETLVWPNGADLSPEWRPASAPVSKRPGADPGSTSSSGSARRTEAGGSHIADPTPIRCSTLYLDKPMRIHTLMQTLA
jgi:hypothetical protein